MRYNIVTISREFGSGGRSIGKEAADILGMRYYDRELIEHVAEKTGFDPEFIAEHGEYAPGTTFFSYVSSSFIHSNGIMGGMNAADYLWVKQRDAIVEIASREPCVIVGRCADYILRDRTDALHVFIHANKRFRAERIVRLYGENENKPEERLKEKDGRRSVNYKYRTGREWGDRRNYHLTLNSGALGIDTCVKIITSLVKGDL